MSLTRLSHEKGGPLRRVRHWWYRTMNGHDVVFYDEMDRPTRNYMDWTSNPSVCWVCGKPAEVETVYPPYGPGDSGHRQQICSEHAEAFRQQELTSRHGCLDCGGEFVGAMEHNPACPNCVRNHAYHLGVRRELL